MPSRMERYADTKLTRTAKNQELYDEIYENKEYPENKRYSNIEGVVKTPAAEKLDIERIKEIINRREENSRLQQKRYIKTVQELPTVQDDEEENDTYDLNDVLNKAKDERPINKEDYHSLKNVEFNILRNLKIRKDIQEAPDDELKELIDTITGKSKLNKLGDKELSLDLLDDLKSNNNTIIGSSDSIRKILKEEKKPTEEDEEMDKSFYTKSMNLTEDLEGLKPKKENKTIIKIFVIISIIVCIIVGGFIIYNLIKK